MRAEERFYPAREDFRDPWTRDRDRVLHSSAFRRLEYKTQVFINSEGDYYRTRLTHSLEASQIARAICAALGLTEALAEAIGLAHDLGHTPFGHIGGDTLDELLREQGSCHGFDHNYQSFRVVCSLERRHPSYPGLNLTYATLEGILKHSFPYRKSFLPEDIYSAFALDHHPSLEAMIVDKSDEIAYICADIDDGLKCGLIGFEALLEHSLICEVYDEVAAEGIAPQEDIFRLRFSTGLMDRLINDLIRETRERIVGLHLPTGEPLCGVMPAGIDKPVRFCPHYATEIKQIKKSLFQKLYHHEQILIKMHFGRNCIRGIFEACIEEPGIMPPEYRQRLDKTAKYRVIADFITGLTDRSAEKLYRDLY